MDPKRLVAKLEKAKMWKKQACQMTNNGLNEVFSKTNLST